MSDSRHTLIEADCVSWLGGERKGFDLIVLDPPSFSNSKRMSGTLDIQRDHQRLISACLARLNPGGKMYFSTNLRKFKLDPALTEKLCITDISSATIDEDFKRRPGIHKCWEISHG
jgi:23S rRNA (guanine2445-N2)-methyltransferase / 23S rRNA (guanine2069-N7)-methyltransferase